MLQKVSRRPVDLLRVARHLLVENTRPDESVKLELRRVTRDAMDKEVVVEVLADGKEVVV